MGRSRGIIDWLSWFGTAVKIISLELGASLWLTDFVHLHVFTVGDHGVKAQGAGWLLTVTLVEAQGLYSIDSDGSCDPYVVFTCNGKIRTSSVILGCFNPQWKGMAISSDAVCLFESNCRYWKFSLQN